MSETPVRDTPIAENLEGDDDEVIVQKDWEQFDACERCRGRAPIDETEDGNLYCHLCGAKLPRPSS